MADWTDLSVGCLDRMLLSFAAARLDYFQAILGLSVDEPLALVESFIRAGGSMIFPYEKVCIICDVPPSQ